MRNPKSLLESEDRWVTDVGAWFPGERVVFRGLDLLRDLAKRPWIELLLYGITGRQFTIEQYALLEALWSFCISYPDPRLWNNRVSALGGTARTTASLAIAASVAVSEATIYGQRPIIQSFDFLIRTQLKLRSGDELSGIVEAEMKEFRGIPGYGRPVVDCDERIEPLMSYAKKLGLADGPYLELAYATGEILNQNRWRLRMNVAAVAAGLAADQGLSAREYHHFLVLGFSAGFFPVYLDAAEKPEGTFFPLRCKRVEYEGCSKREWGERSDDTTSVGGT